jgi:hypothetical protein
VLALGTVALGSSAGHAATPNPRAFNLKLSDLPSGFLKAQDDVLDNSALAKVPGTEGNAATLSKEGRVLTSEEGFYSPKGPKTGLRGVTPTIIAFNTAANARADYLRYTAELRHLPAYAHNEVNPSLLAGVGAARVAWKLAQGGQPPQIIDTLVFYRGRYEVVLGTVYLTKEVLSQELVFARLIDARIRAAS